MAGKSNEALHLELIELFSSGKEPIGDNFKKMIDEIFAREDGKTPLLTKNETHILVSYDDGANNIPLISLEELKGPTGNKGETGVSGQKGDTGLQGQKGDTGLQGLKGTDGTNGTNGSKGIDGKSAFELAKANGFVGTEPEWITSLKGSKGDTGNTGATGKSIKSLELTVEETTNKITSGTVTFSDNSTAPVTITTI